MRGNFYINFDFGLRGDYKGLYKWLDKYSAEERGNGYAYIKGYDFPDEGLDDKSPEKEKTQKFIGDLRNEIMEYVTLDPSDRIYVTFKVFETDNIGGHISIREETINSVGRILP